MLPIRFIHFQIATFVIALGLIGTTDAYSQSTERISDPPSVEKPTNRSAQSVDALRKLKDVVLRYFQYARAGDSTKLRRLVFIPPRPKSVVELDGEQPSYDIIGELDRRFLEKEMPASIRAGDEFVIEIGAVKRSAGKGEVSISLGSKIDPQALTHWTFDVVLLKGEWRISSVSYAIDKPAVLGPRNR